MQADRYERVQALIRAHLAQQHVPEALDAALEALVAQVEGDPELRRQVIRDSLRSSLMAGYWLRPS